MAKAEAKQVSRVEEFKSFLKELRSVKRDILTVLTKALKFVEGVNVNAKALSENPPLFYDVGIGDIMFVWESGLTFEIYLYPIGENEWKISYRFDHLARAEVVK